MSHTAILDIENDEQLEKTIDDAVESGAPLIIKWSATWCGPCKAIQPLFEQLSQEYPDLIFIHADVEGCPDMAASYGITAMPTFCFIYGGQMYKMQGANRQQLQIFVKQHYDACISR